MQHSVLRHAADNSKENSATLGLVRGLPSPPADWTRAESFEPPEKSQHKGQRIFLSLCIQVIAKYFVSVTLPPPVEFQDPGDAHLDEFHFSTSNSSRSKMRSRLRAFRSVGAEALLALVVVKSGSRVLLTVADKQLALWTLREVCVSAYEVETSEGNSLMIWCKQTGCLLISDLQLLALAYPCA